MLYIKLLSVKVLLDSVAPVSLLYMVDFLEIKHFSLLFYNDLTV